MIQQIIIGVTLVFSLAFSFGNPFVAMITLMGVNMIQPGELYPIYNALHVERVVALVALVVLLAKGYRFVFPRVTKTVLYFYCACVASIPLAFWVGNAITCAENFGKIIIIHLLYVSVVTTRKRMHIVLYTFAVLVGYLAVTSLILYFQGHFLYTMDVDRIVGLTEASNNPDSLGLTLATAIPFMYLLTLKSSGKFTRLLMWGLILLSLWTLLLTGSRGSLFTFILIAVLGICRNRRRFVYLPALVVTALVVWSFLPAQYKARYMTVKDLSADESYTNRLLSWEGGWHMFLHNPLTGVGIGNYADANGTLYWPAPRKVWLDAHSLYFKILGELGLVGAVTFTMFVTAFVQTDNLCQRRLKEVDERARAGDPNAEPVPEWLRLFPVACTLSVIGLMYCGYAYHDVYRSTWYFLAAAAGALDIILAQEVARLGQPAAAGEPQPSAVNDTEAIAWSQIPVAAGSGQS